MNRFFSLTVALGVLWAPIASAADVKLCIIDAETALNETEEGKSAQGKLESMYAAKQKDIDKVQEDLEKQFQDYEQRKLILSDTAREEQERSLLEKRQSFQNLVLQAEQEMQETYLQLLSGMEEKLLGHAADIGKAEACTLLMPKEATIYVGAGVVDLTQKVIASLDAK